MSNKEEALKLALEALKLSAVTVDSFGVQRKTQIAITAIKEALAQPAPIVSLECANCQLTIEQLNDKVMRLMAQPAQEPVSLLSDEVIEQAGREWWAQTRHTNGPRTLNAYASRGIMDEVHSTARIIIQSALLAQAKLKERNHG